jgi:hypothetical protein
MKIGGWKTNSIFRRYAIVCPDDIANAMEKFQIREAELHDKCQISASEPKTAPLTGSRMVQ